MAPYPCHEPFPPEVAHAADLACPALGLPTLLLMDHAGRGLAELAEGLRRGPGPVVVACGPGNNGGDGYAAVRFLASHGVPVRAVRLVGDAPRRGDAATEATLALSDAPLLELPRDLAAGVARAAVEDASLLLDALFGVGLARPLAPPYVTWIEAMNACACPRLAADVPSGLDARSGAPRPVAVRADVTAAMGAPKPGHRTAEGARWCGRVVELDVGWPRALHAARVLPPPGA